MTKINFLKIITGIGASMAIAGSAIAGPAAPTFWTSGAANDSTASHWGRFTTDPVTGNRTFDTTSLLQQHHTGAHLNTGSFDPSTSAVRDLSGGAVDPNENFIIHSPHVTGTTGRSQTRIRVEVASEDTAANLFAQISATDSSGGAIIQAAGALNTVDGQNIGGALHDFSWQDFIVTGGTIDWSEFTIDALGGNVLQAWVFTVQQVPVPAAVWLFGTGLLGMVGVSRRQRPQTATA